MILDMDDVTIIKKGSGRVVTKNVSLDTSKQDKATSVVAPPSPPHHPSGQVVKRTLMTMVEITIYPNGQTYTGKMKSWFNDKVQYVKKKKAVILKKDNVSVANEREVY